MQGELPETGGGAGRPVGSDPTPIPAPNACPHAPCPEIAKILKKTRLITNSLKRRFKQLAVSMASCGYSWVMASRGDGAWVPGNEIGKLEDLPREQGSRIVALARTWYGDPSMTTMAVPKGKLFAGVAGSVLPPKRRQRLRPWICDSFFAPRSWICGSQYRMSRHYTWR